MLMAGTTENTHSWIKEETDLFESATFRELDHLNEKTNDHIKWFKDCTTISQLLAWGGKANFPTQSITTKKDLHRVGSTDLQSRKHYGITPEDFVETVVAEESPTIRLVSREVSETKAIDFNGTMLPIEIRDIVEEREIQLAPELDNILNYDPKEAEYVKNTPELEKYINTQTQLKRSSPTLKQTDNNQNDDEILLFVSSRKSTEHTIKSPLRRETKQNITKNLTQLTPDILTKNPGAISPVNTFISASQSKTTKIQSIDPSSFQLNNSISPSNLTFVKVVDKYIPLNQSTGATKNTPIEAEHHQGITPVETEGIKTAEANPIKQDIENKPVISNYVETAKKNVESEKSSSNKSIGLEASDVNGRNSSGHSNSLTRKVKVTSDIEVSEVMPQKPFRKKLRIASSQKTPVEEHKEVKVAEVQDKPDKESAKQKSKTPSWATEPELFEHIKNQESMDPDNIFGPCAPVIMNEIFN